MTPFTYPSAPLARRHGPVGYLDYGKLDSSLGYATNSVSGCDVYCTQSGGKRWEPDLGVFEIDHFASVRQSPELRVAYRNLIYSCTACNAAKRDQVLPDPAMVFLSTNVLVESDGRACLGKRPKPGFLIRLLDLNDPMFVTWRMRMIRIVALARPTRSHIIPQPFCAYPDDLPDLSGASSSLWQYPAGRHPRVAL